MSAGGTLPRLQRAARDQRRAGPPTEWEQAAAAWRAMPPPASPSLPPIATLPAADLERRLAQVRQRDARLHASLERLDGPQLQAVLSDEPSVLVRAQVGSGKTTVLVHKVLYLHVAGGVPLAELCVLTFTNRAADELRARIDDLAGRTTAPGERWLMGTFHGVARTLLDRALPLERAGHRPGFEVLDDEQLDQLLAGLARVHGLRLRSRRRLCDQLRRAGADEPPGGGGELARLAALAEAEKRARNVMGFDDLLEHATALLAGAAPLPPRWLLVNEAQDCEPRELALLRGLRGPGTRFFGVGDPHQAIYGWRGSAPDVFAQMAFGLGCRGHELPVNYRCTRVILEGARAVLGAQPVGGGSLEGVRGDGAPIVVRRHHDPVCEAVYLAARVQGLHGGGVPLREIAVLCRLRAQVETLARLLDGHGVRCALADDPGPDGVRLLTLHAAKGLEFRHVFISGVNLGVVPLPPRRDDGGRDDEAEERRLLFVGVTRARDTVELAYHGSPHAHGASGGPSPYLHRLPAALVEWDDGTARGPPSLPSALDAGGPPPGVAAPWLVGQGVRHARYGDGVVVQVGADNVDCDFGKRGRRTFSLALAPLATVPGGAAVQAIPAASTRAGAPGMTNRGPSVRPAIPA